MYHPRVICNRGKKKGKEIKRLLMVVLVFYGVDELDSSFLKEEGTLFLGWDRDDLVSYVSSPGT